MAEYRWDQDSLGKVRIPDGAYYGAFTGRAIKQYHVTGRTSHKHLVRAFVMIKRSAAVANQKMGAIDDARGRAIISACDRILSGKHADQFVVDMINSGAGTAFNMNTNEVIANVALYHILKKKRGQYEHLHPNDHVNMSQSSNDTYPTAMHMAILFNLNESIPALRKLAESLDAKASEFAKYKKIGRTHLMDALPVTLGGEFGAHAVAIKRTTDALESTKKMLCAVALGGTAVGTGANTPRGYRKIAIAELAKISGLPLRAEKDMQFGLQSRSAVAATSGSLRNLALEVGRLANDVRLMASGPVAGFSEIGIPAVHAGSSIMPGKVNPSLAECMNMVCFSIIGNDAATAHAAHAGQFELNVMLPGMLNSVLESTDMIKRFVPIFAANLIDGLVANDDRLRKDIENSPVIVTLLAPKIGYLKSAELFKESLNSGMTIRELAVSKGIVSESEFDALLK